PWAPRPRRTRAPLSRRGIDCGPRAAPLGSNGQTAPRGSWHGGRTHMPRPVILYSGTWADRPLEELAPLAAEWGYDGLELVCWGDHVEVQRALGEDDYCAARLALLNRLELSV